MARELPELAMGIGINTGEVIVGNIGSEQRMKYGAVGSAINTAYRIESHTIGGQILLSPDTYARVRELAWVRGTVTVEFKGLDRALTLHDVSGLAGAYGLALPEPAGDELVRLESPLPVACHPIEGKTVSVEAISGAIVRLGRTIAELVLEAPVPPHANLKVVLRPGPAGTSPELYAKVLAALGEAGADAGTVRVGFTSVPDDVLRCLDGQGTVRP